MVFSSLFFVFVFMVLNYLAQAMCSTIRGKNIVMLLFSLVFYAWGGPKYLLLLFAMTVICWFGALLVECSVTPTQRKAFLALTSALMLGLLGYFKYAVFLLENLQAYRDMIAAGDQTGLTELLKAGRERWEEVDGPKANKK